MSVAPALQSLSVFFPASLGPESIRSGRWNGWAGMLLDSPIGFPRPSSGFLVLISVTDPASSCRDKRIFSTGCAGTPHSALPSHHNSAYLVERIMTML